jgi:hypothetical protein
VRTACLVATILAACGESPQPSDTTAVPPTTPSGAPAANVSAVSASGDPGGYTFAVSIRSDETGCDRYADWWEVLDPAGNLLYRRILDHSHPDEQPFTRTGGPVPALPDDVVIVRAHLHDVGEHSGFGAGMQGSVAGGFAAAELPADFAAALETAEPLPAECLF